jgi:hypothetical protein
MNALEIIGKAAVDPAFRRTLFANVDAVIAENRAHLPQEQEDCLRRVVQPTCPVRAGSRGEPEENTLDQALSAVGQAIARMCPQEPCAWP